MTVGIQRDGGIATEMWPAVAPVPLLSKRTKLLGDIDWHKPLEALQMQKCGIEGRHGTQRPIVVL
jgi:hypothetical protein